MDSTTEYDIRDSLADCGYDFEPGETIISHTAWTVMDITQTAIIFRHPQGTIVRVTQRKPVGRDTPFKTIRVKPPANDEFELAAGDWLAEQVTAAKAYMIGFAERT